MKNQLFCGAGRAEITPSEEYLKNLEALGPQHFSGILDQLYVRTIILKNETDAAMIVSLDLDKAPNHDEFTEMLSEQTGVPADRILFFGIHTHTAPIMGYRPFEPNGDVTKKSKPEQEAYYRYNDLLREALKAAAAEALQTLQPAKLGCGHGKSYININRCCNYTLTDSDGQKKKIVETGYNGDGPVDRDVFLLRAESMEGKPIAFFINYAMHNVAMFLHDSGDGGILVSHDIAGAVTLSMEKQFPGAVAVWSSGAAGNINPIIATQNYFPQLKDGYPDLAPVADLKMSIELRDRLAGRHLMDILEANQQLICDIESGAISGKICYVEPSGECEENLGNRIRLRMIRVGELALVGVNGELFSTLGAIIKENSPLKETVVINHDCSLMLDNPGYVLDDETNALCEEADEVRMPSHGFKEKKGYLPKKLAEMTRELFQ